MAEEVTTNRERAVSSSLPYRGQETLDEVLRESAAWSEKTFQAATIQSIATHLAREANELKQNPTDPMEMADVLLLLAHLALRNGIDLATIARTKLEVNKLRKWGEVDAEGVVEHVRVDTYSPPAGSTYEIDERGVPTGRKLIYYNLSGGEHSWIVLLDQEYHTSQDLEIMMAHKTGRQFSEGFDSFNDKFVEFVRKKEGLTPEQQDFLDALDCPISVSVHNQKKGQPLRDYTEFWNSLTGEQKENLLETIREDRHNG
jgi:hypothetical protein